MKNMPLRIWSLPPTNTLEAAPADFSCTSSARIRSKLESSTAFATRASSTGLPMNPSIRRSPAAASFFSSSYFSTSTGIRFCIVQLRTLSSHRPKPTEIIHGSPPSWMNLRAYISSGISGGSPPVIRM
jgi:hypothetical protein